MIGGLALSARELDALWPRLREEHDGTGSDELAARIVWGVLAEPGDGVAGRLVADLGAADALELVLRRAAFPDLVALRAEAQRIWSEVRSVYAARRLEPPSGVRAAFQRWHPRMTGELIENALRMCATVPVRLLVPSDPEWPTGFAALGDHAPVLLWCRGRVGLLVGEKPAIALVGTRSATGYGTHVATELAGELAERGWTIASGGAYGIDAVAHRAAIAAQGHTIAAMAGGLETFYPAGNQELLARVARDGLVIGEVPFGTPPSGFRFLARNRLIAALSAAVVVVEAGTRSGSLNTANHAGKLGRPLGAVPGPVTSPASEGCHLLLREHRAEPVTNAADAIELAGGRLAEPEPLADPGDPRFGRVRAALSTRSARSVIDVAARSGLAAEEAAALLGVLLLDGIVRKTDAGWVSVPRRG